MHKVTVVDDGAPLLDGDWHFLRRDAGSATRITDAPTAAAVIAPGKMKRIGIIDLNVSLAHSHANTLGGTARQMVVKVFGCLVWCSGCSAPKGGGWLSRGRPGAAPPGHWSVLSWICGGRGRVCRRGAVPDDDRRRLLADGVDIFP